MRCIARGEYGLRCRLSEPHEGQHKFTEDGELLDELLDPWPNAPLGAVCCNAPAPGDPGGMNTRCNRVPHPYPYDHRDRNGVKWPQSERRAQETRGSILEEAQRLIHGDREKDYGPPLPSFESIAALWSTYLRQRPIAAGKEDWDVTAVDVAHMMILLKISRTMTGGIKRDSLVDIAGYAGCIERFENG